MAALLVAPVHAAHKLTPHTAEYKVKISVVSGKLKTELQATDSGYVAKHNIAPSGWSRAFKGGAISEVSRFDNGSEGLVPIAYQTTDTLSRDKVRANISFDWDRNEASGTVNDQEVLTVLEGLSHDRVSIQYELMHNLLNDEAGTQYRLYEVDKLKTINVSTLGKKQVKVPAGTYEAVGIQHQAEGSSRITTLWCVEELDYLPVIIEQHRKGKLKVRATLRKYAPSPEAVGLSD